MELHKISTRGIENKIIIVNLTVEGISNEMARDFSQKLKEKTGCAAVIVLPKGVRMQVHSHTSARRYIGRMLRDAKNRSYNEDRKRSKNK